MSDKTFDNLPGRMLKYLEYQKVKPTNFEEQNGITKGYLMQCAKKGTILGSDYVEKFLANFDNINISWLFTGRGPMDMINLGTGDNGKVYQYLIEEQTDYWLIPRGIFKDHRIVHDSVLNDNRTYVAEIKEQQKQHIAKIEKAQERVIAVYDKLYATLEQENKDLKERLTAADRMKG